MRTRHHHLAPVRVRAPDTPLTTTLQPKPLVTCLCIHVRFRMVAPLQALIDAARGCGSLERIIHYILTHSPCTQHWQCGSCPSLRTPNFITVTRMGSPEFLVSNFRDRRHHWTHSSWPLRGSITSNQKSGEFVLRFLLCSEPHVVGAFASAFSVAVAADLRGASGSLGGEPCWLRNAPDSSLHSFLRWRVHRQQAQVLQAPR